MLLSRSSFSSRVISLVWNKTFLPQVGTSSKWFGLGWVDWGPRVPQTPVLRVRLTWKRLDLVRTVVWRLEGRPVPQHGAHGTSCRPACCMRPGRSSPPFTIASVYAGASRGREGTRELDPPCPLPPVWARSSPSLGPPPCPILPLPHLPLP